MRFALLASAAVTAVATALLAIAQPLPGKPPEAAPATGRTLLPIDWNEVRSELKNQRLQRVNFKQMLIAQNAPRPSLPMLLPFESSFAAATANVFPRPDSYSASMRLGDITVEVHGDRRAMTLDAKDPLARMMQAKQQIAMMAGANVPFSLDKTEGGFDLTFGRFGAAYLVSIECAKPETDEHCVKTDFIRSLGERMGLIGADGP
ncbi:MAG: hypothetical protein KBA31_12195 [Alphaproteobacteria bacterium]|nr:hypothetical protein [Alphaproteobacteria bacterium]